MKFLEVLKSLPHFYLPNADGVLIVILTWGIFFAAIIGLSRHAATLRATEAQLSQLQEIKEEKESRNFLESDLAKAISGLPENSFFHRYSGMMNRQAEFEDVDKRSLLEIAFERFHADLAMPRNAPNLCLLVGLSGTIIGLASVVRDLGPLILNAAGADSPQKMAEPLALSIGTLGTAFASTLNGITAAGLLAYIIAKAERRQNLLQSHIEEWGLNSLCPLVFPRSLQSQLSDMKGILRETSGLMIAIKKSLTEQIDEVAATLKTATGGMQAQIEKFDQTSKESADSLRQFGEQTKKAALVLGESVLKMNDLQTEVHATYTSLMQRHDLAEENFKSRVETLVSTVEKMQTGFNTNASAIVGQIQAAATNYTDSASDFKVASLNFSNMSAQIGSKAYDAIADTANEFHSALSEHKRSIDLTEKSLREIMVRLDPSLLPVEKWESLLASLDLIQETVAKLNIEGVRR